MIFTPIHLIAILSSFLLTLLLVPAIRKIALKLKAEDQPENTDRKIHKKPTPLLGGLAIFISVFLILFLFRVFNLADFSRVPDNFLWGIIIGAILIMIGGFLDDKYNLKPWQQIIWPILAVIVVLIAGIRVGYITNPIGGPDNAIIYLSPTIGIIITFLWLMGMMYTTKFLDGLDGLVSGITVIAALVIFLLSLDWDVNMSATGILALILAGSAFGFLLFNWHPAKIFLGEGGSIYLGFMLGILSIISGSKITTTLLVVGLPALDVLWVIIQRLINRQSPFSHADNKHLHFQLLKLGFSHRGSVLFLYLLSLIFGAVAIFASSFGKLVGLIFLIVVMVILAIVIYINSKKYGIQKI